jgi:hypothetical protein
MNSINQIRYDNFDRAIEDALFSVSTPIPGMNSKKDLKLHFQRKLGITYMQNHSVGIGPDAQIEDAKAALSAYWRIAEKRLLDDVVSCVDIVLLNKGSELIEQTLLSEAQNWTKEGVLNAMVCENIEVTKKRIDLKQKKYRAELALQRIHELSPGCIAKDPKSRAGLFLFMFFIRICF